QRVARPHRAGAGPAARSDVRGRRVGDDDRAGSARHRRVPRSGAAGRLVRVRHGRRAPARGARPAAERTRQRRAAPARRTAGRPPPPLASAQRRLFRSGLVVSAERRLGRPLGLYRVPGPLMNELPRAARIYVGAVIATGLALLLLRLPEASFAQPLLLVALLLLSSM